MTDATYEADGSQPIGTDRFSLLRAHPGKAIAAGVTLAAAVIAVAAMSALSPAVKAPVEAAVRTMKPMVTPPAVNDTVDTKGIVQALLVQAGLRRPSDLHHLSLGQARKVNALMPEAVLPPDAVKPFVLSVDTKEGRQALHCLTQAAYFEAGGNGPEAEAGVVQVVLNRVRHPDFPKSVCGVVYQGSARKTGCQFTFTCDGALKRALDAAAWNEARKVAARALNGYVVAAVGAATYYHADYVFPAWAPTLIKMATIGPHIFYRMAGEEGRAAYLTGKYAGGELKLSKALLRAADALTQNRDSARRAEASLKLASLKVEAVKGVAGQRVHAQIAQAPSEDARLNAAQTIQPMTPVLASAPVVVPAPSSQPQIAPVASADSPPAV